MTKNPRDHRAVLDNRQVPHLITAVGAYKGIHLVDFFDQRGDGQRAALMYLESGVSGSQSSRPVASGSIVVQHGPRLLDRAY